MRGIDPDLRIFVAGMDASVTGIRSIPQLNLPNLPRLLVSTLVGGRTIEQRKEIGRRSISRDRSWNVVLKLRFDSSVSIGCRAW